MSATIIFEKKCAPKIKPGLPLLLDSGNPNTVAIIVKKGRLADWLWWKGWKIEKRLSVYKDDYILLTGPMDEPLVVIIDGKWFTVWAGKNPQVVGWE